MARRTKQEVLAEFHHLRDCFDAFLTAFAPNWSSEDAAFMQSHIITRDEMLSWIDKGKTTASGVVAGVKAGIADWKLALRDLERYHPEKAQIFHDSYVDLRGKRFLDDIQGEI